MLDLIIPSLLVFLSVSGQGRQERLLCDFSKPAEYERWRSVNDRVMGGLSSGSIRSDPAGYAVFSGSVSFENNGGFASVRSLAVDLDLRGYRGISLQVRGDGKSYRLTLKLSPESDGVMYMARFTAEGAKWRTVQLPFDGFVPTFRGRALNDVPPVDPREIKSIGFMIADRQEGPFKLDIRAIEAYEN
jgi:monofunctional biosynthetic peptidoglycan transglycosylase